MSRGKSLFVDEVECAYCGLIFERHACNQKYCSPECKKQARLEQMKTYSKEGNSRRVYQKEKDRNRMLNRMPPKKTLEEVSKEIKEYNEEHGTWITYGEWMATHSYV